MKKKYIIATAVVVVINSIGSISEMKLISDSYSSINDSTNDSI